MTCEEERTANIVLAIVGRTVVNSTFVILFGISAKLSICASNPPPSPSPVRCVESGSLRSQFQRNGVRVAHGVV
jgi:hypothetical protein